jgi:hypothetical protein
VAEDEDTEVVVVEVGAAVAVGAAGMVGEAGGAREGGDVVAGEAGGAVVAGDAGGAVNEAEDRREEDVCSVDGFRRSLCLLSLRMISGMRSGLTNSTMQYPFATSM